MAEANRATRALNEERYHSLLKILGLDAAPATPPSREGT